MKFHITIKSVVSVNQNQVSADISPDFSGNVVVLDLKNGKYYGLEDASARVWNLIQQPISLQSILDKLLEEYEVTPQQCEIDLFALIEDLAKYDLIEINNEVDA